MEEEKTVTKSQLIEIFKNWPVEKFESLEDVERLWNNPQYPIDCADQVWKNIQ